MRTSVRARDFIAPILIWALALTGCVIGKVTPAQTRLAAVCGPAAVEAR